MGTSSAGSFWKKQKLALTATERLRADPPRLDSPANASTEYVGSFVPNRSGHRCQLIPSGALDTRAPSFARLQFLLAGKSA